MSKLLFQLEESYFLWGEIFPEPFGQGNEANISCNYDYEINPGGKKCVYIDLGVKLNYAYVAHRSGFEFKNKSLSRKDIFVPDNVNAMLSVAFEETQKGYKVFCDANVIQMPVNAAIPPALLDTFANTILDQYSNYRSIADQENAYLINTTFLECEPHAGIHLLFKYTFQILQEVLFYHPAFNKINNREVFSEIIPLPRYFTLRNNGRAVEFEDLSMNGYDTIMFLQCLDCALQMLLGDKSDALLSVLEAQGFDAELQAAFIQNSTELFSHFNKMFSDSNVHIQNLENRVDWLNLIK